MNAKMRFLERALDKAYQKPDYSSGFSFMCGLVALQVNVDDSDSYGDVLALVSSKYGADEADALDNAMIKYSHRLKK
jgi:hypothetical protein